MLFRQDTLTGIAAGTITLAFRRWDRPRVLRRLDRLDRSRRTGPWTAIVLDLIGRRPAVRAATLAAEVGRETLNFKQDVRKLKELGSRKASKSVTGCRRAAVPCSVGSGMPGRSDTLAHEPDIRS